MEMEVHENSSTEKEKVTASITGKLFAAEVLLSQLFAIAIVVLVALWASSLYLGGITWGGESFNDVNTHGVLMVLGMVVLFGEASIAFRVLTTCMGKYKVKLIHSALLTAAFVFIILGLIAIITVYNSKGITHMHSIHSWCGVICVALFASQLVLGFWMFLWPGASDSTREKYHKFHLFCGSLIWVLVFASCLTGINEKLMYKGQYTIPNSYGTLEPLYVVGNLLGLMIILYTAVVLWITRAK